MASAVAAVGGALVGWGVAGTATAAYYGASIAYTAYSASQERERDTGPSRTYSLGKLGMDRSHRLPVPVVYGEHLVSGNVIYEDIYGGDNDNRFLEICLAVSEGPISDIKYIKADDINLSENEVQLVDPINGTVENIDYWAFGKNIHLSNLPDGNWEDAVLTINNKKAKITNYSVSKNTTEIRNSDFDNLNIQVGDNYILEQNYDSYLSEGSYANKKLGERSQTPSEFQPDEHYPYTAYIASIMDAKELEMNGSPTLTCIVEGRKIDVYDGSNWTNQYSNNPAWVVYDFLTNSRYGLGFDDDSLDENSFLSVANWCDENNYELK